MGYYSRIYIVRKYERDYDSKLKKCWAHVTMLFHLGRVYGLYERMEQYPDTDCFIYDDQDNPILEDCYGKPLTEISIDALISELDALTIKELKPYNPDIRVLLAALKEIQKYTEFGYNDMVCLHYGE